MRLPAVTYRIDDLLPGASSQAVHGSDRPLCALVAAAASMMRGNVLKGAALNMESSRVAAMLMSAFRAEGVPDERLDRWISAVNETRIDEGWMRQWTTPELPMSGLTPSRYQVNALPKLTLAGGLLAYDPGLGKTLISAIGARTFVQLGLAQMDRCWIVAPLNAMGAWKRYLPELKEIFKEVLVVSIDSAHKLVGADRKGGGLLIIDEIHNAGHITARRTKALFKIRPAFDACIGCTGTLLHIGVEAALTVLDLVIPGSAGFATKWTAGEYWHCLVKKDFGTGRVVVKLERPTGPNKDSFLQHMSRYAVVLTQQSEEVREEAGIPLQHLHTIDMGGAEDEDIDDCIVRIVHQLMEGLPDDAPIPHASAIVHAALAEGVEEKWDWVLDRIDDPSEGLVIFAEYHTSLDLIEAKLKDSGMSYVRVDGSVTGAARDQARADFQDGKVQVFLGQIEAAGESIDLYRACISVAIDHTQKSWKYSQALKRTCRRGQTRECHHFDLVCNPVQAKCLRRLRAGEDFHLSLADYQQKLRK